MATERAAAAPATNYDPRVDAKIAAAAPTLRPVLHLLREIVHEAAPEATETMKWNMPFFECNGTILANMGVFKQHCSFGFWSRSMTEHLATDGLVPAEGAGSLGKITHVEDLPSRKKLLGYVHTAAEHIRKGTAASPMQVRAAKRGPDGNASSKPVIPMPPAFAEALQSAPLARQAFDTFPPSCRREYLVWITEAKREETRTRRIQQAIAQLEQGKRHNWQYQSTREQAGARSL